MILKVAISAAGLVVLTVVVISLFLRVDSLSRCGSHPSDVRGCQAADVVIAVSGGDTAGRTQYAIDLYERGWGRKLVFSGAALDKSGPSNAAVMRDQAIRQGVPAHDIITEQQSTTTSENADLTAEVLRDLGAESAILVTSGYHQKRTLIEFERRAPNVDFRVQSSASDRQWSVWWWTTPQGWYLAVSEIIKIIISTVGGR